jgi:hypothetical protein
MKQIPERNLQTGDAADAARWREMCRIGVEQDEAALEFLENNTPSDVRTKEVMDIAMDAWIQARHDGYGGAA